MATTKLVDSNRRTHAAKVLAEASSRNKHPHENDEHTDHIVDVSKNVSWNKQYNIIKKDVLQLRQDIVDGYEILKKLLRSRLNVRLPRRAK